MIACQCRHWYTWASVAIWFITAGLVLLGLLQAPLWFAIMAIVLGLAGAISTTCKECRGFKFKHFCIGQCRH